jgi:mannose-1-phosphate guanylyltransferase
LLGYWFDFLFRSGIERVLVNTHYLPKMVQTFVRDCPWRDKVDLTFEEVLLGTGGTVLANRKWIGSRPFLVAHSDNLTCFDPAAFISRHDERPANCAITMMTFDTITPQSCGIVEEKEGVVFAFHEKVPNPPGVRANAAVYVFEAEILDFLASLGKPVIDLSTEVLPHFLGRIWTFHNERYHRDIGTPESLRLAETEFCLEQ